MEPLDGELSIPHNTGLSMQAQNQPRQVPVYLREEDFKKLEELRNYCASRNIEIRTLTDPVPLRLALRAVRLTPSIVQLQMQIAEEDRRRKTSRKGFQADE